jgi:hypothetical protein
MVDKRSTIDVLEITNSNSQFRKSYTIKELFAYVNLLTHHNDKNSCDWPKKEHINSKNDTQLVRNGTSFFDATPAKNVFSKALKTTSIVGATTPAPSLSHQLPRVSAPLGYLKIGDIRKLDSNYNTKEDTVILNRRNCILLLIYPVRAILLFDRLLLILSDSIINSDERCHYISSDQLVQVLGPQILGYYLLFTSSMVRYVL